MVSKLCEREREKKIDFTLFFSSPVFYRTLCFRGGETYYCQVDSHLQFARNWDQLYIENLQRAKSYPKAVLSTYVSYVSCKTTDDLLILFDLNLCIF